MAQPLKSLTYEDVELFCEQTLQAGGSVTIERLLAEFPNDPVDVVAYFDQWHQDKLNKSLNTSSQNSDNKSETPPNISQVMQEEIAKQHVSHVKDQQTLQTQQQDIEQFLITKSQELQANLEGQSKFVDEAHKQLKQQSQKFQEQFQQLTSGYNDEVNILKQHHQQSLLAQQEAHQIAIERVINENAAQLDNLSDQVTQLAETNTFLEAKADEYLASQQQVSKLQTTIDQLEKQLTEEKAEQAQHIATAKKQYQANLNALRDAHQQEISELKTSHQSELVKASSQNVQQADESSEQLSKIQQDNKVLKQQLAEAQSKSAQLHARLVNVSNDTSKDRETKTKLLASLEEANSKIILLEQQISQQRTGLTEESDLNSLEKAERMITVLRSENNKLANQLHHIKTNSIATIERLTDKSDQAMTRIKELESQLDLEVQSNSSAKVERIALKEKLELMKHNQASTFERLTNNVEKAKAKIKALEQQLAQVNS
ncbi:hypothetical protein [Thalassotalea sp. G2M2-11]|uniref:hypothetical protein n=1 Tax=Thalassotalea sp. G2M2-11 TaxID=2787627 RepID=UPI0019D23FF0|nr:hypothetical protein [Thalassotalea sp. G2M2-11]